MSESPRWSPYRVLGRGIQVLKEDGVAALAFKVLGETVYRRALVMEKSLDEPMPDVCAPTPVVMGWLDKSQVDDYLALQPIVRIDAREILRRLQNGQACCTARCDGHLVYVSWSTTRRAWVSYLQCEMELAPDEVYVYEAFAAPEARGRDVAWTAGMFRLRHFAAAGYKRSVAVVNPENRRARAWLRSMGYHSRGTMGYVRLGPWRRDFFRPIARRAPDPPDWGERLVQLRGDGHYLDPFLARLKKDALVQLVARWGGAPRAGLTLKTDLFEEADGRDGFLFNVAEADRAVGIDLSPMIARYAKEREPRAACLAADVRALPFARDSFALVLSPSTLDHFRDPQDLNRSLRELARVLAPGGRLIITLDNRQNVSDPLFRLANRLGWLPYFVGHSLTVRGLRVALESVGLEVSDTTAILHNPRLFAVAVKMLANRISWHPLTALVERALVAAQKLGDTPLCYFSGSFVAARACKRTDGNAECP